MPGIVLPYEPIVIVETIDLPQEEWLALRKTGIGGSDVAAIFGISPFGTARDVYYDKLSISSVYDEEANKYQKKIGTLLEDTVAEMFAEQTGYQIFKIRKMYRSREHPFMIADIDYFVLLPDGSIAILECKTTAPDAISKWWDGTKPVVPVNYQLQGRHYMSVMHIDKVFFACLHGNSMDYLLTREMDRDMEYESEMIAIEEYFWNNHVMRRLEPPYIEEGDLITESVRRRYGPADASIPMITLSTATSGHLRRYLELTALKETAEVSFAEIDKEIKRLKALIAAEMGAGCSACCTLGDTEYLITNNPARRPLVNKENLRRLQAQHPEIYDEYVTFSESRRLVVKEQRDTAA